MKTLRQWCLLVAVLGWAACLSGVAADPPVDDRPAEPPPPPARTQPPDAPGRLGNGRGTPMRDHLRKSGDEFLTELKEESPEEYRDLMALRDKDPEAFTRELVRRMREGRSARGMNMGGDGDRRGMGPPQNRGGAIGNALREFREKNPEEYERVQELRKTDPEAFREEMRKLFEGRSRELLADQTGISFAEQEEVIRRLAKAWREAATDEERQRLREELIDKLNASFDAMTDAQEKQIERIERELDSMKQKLEARQEMRDQVVNRRLEHLLGEGRRGPGGPPGGRRGPKDGGE